jgi:hypothetical protein
MKSFKDYLAESKKTYPFKIRVAGDLPESFESKLKEQLAGAGVLSFEKTGKTPIQTQPMEFPELKNCEVHMYEVTCEYPITTPEVTEGVKALGLDEAHFKVRNSNDHAEDDVAEFSIEPSGKSLLEDPLYSEATKVKAKNYFGDDFNKGFLKDLEKTAKQRKKDGPSEYKLPKTKTDKAGSTGPMTKVSNPDPRKGK